MAQTGGLFLLSDDIALALNMIHILTHQDQRLYKALLMLRHKGCHMALRPIHEYSQKKVVDSRTALASAMPFTGQASVLRQKIA